MDRRGGGAENVAGMFDGNPGVLVYIFIDTPSQNKPIYEFVVFIISSICHSQGVVFTASQWNRPCHHGLVKKGSSWLEPEFVSRHRISLALKAWGE